MGLQTMCGAVQGFMLPLSKWRSVRVDYLLKCSAQLSSSLELSQLGSGCVYIPFGHPFLFFKTTSATASNGARLQNRRLKSAHCPSLRPPQRLTALYESTHPVNPAGIFDCDVKGRRTAGLSDQRHFLWGQEVDRKTREEVTNPPPYTSQLGLTRDCSGSESVHGLFPVVVSHG